MGRMLEKIYQNHQIHINPVNGYLKMLSMIRGANMSHKIDMEKPDKG